MAQDENDLSVTLPDALRLQFAEVQRRLWRVDTTVAAGTMVAGLVISLAALFISDRFWNTSPVLRLVFSLVGVAVVVVAFLRWARRWIWHRPTLRDLARLVQRRFGRLGDRLLGIVELTQEQHHLANFSPALYQAAVRQVADEAREYDFRESISARPAKKMAFGAGVVLAGWLGVSLVLPEASWNAFLRWAAPMGGIPRYTLVELEGLPREMIVPHGEPFAVSGIVRYRSFWKPGRVVGQLLTLPKIKGAVDSGKINLQIPGQVEDSVLRVHVGDAVAAIKISPVYRPSLRELTAQIQLPAYLQYPDVSQPVESGTLNAVEGSRISFHGNISRALASAEMQPADGVVTKLTVEGRNFVTAPAQPDGIAEYTFNWRDDLGLSNAAPLRLSVAMQKDAPPVPDLPGMPRETAMLDSDVLRIRVDANDDYGVRDFGLTWEVSSDTPLTESIIKEAKIMTSSPHAAKASRVFLWSPRMFRVPADSTVELQGFARDFYPDRERARTGIYRITVLSPEEHAELVREQLEGALAKIEEVTRLQEKIAANLRDARDNQKLAASQKSERAGQSKNEQLENSSKLSELSDQAQRAVQEAMKNPVFPPDAIRKWSQATQQWQQLAEDKMKDAANAMQAAQNNSVSPQPMTDAAQKADDVLKALEKMQGAAGRHMDDLQALTLSQRLHKIASQEKEIGGQLLKSAPDTIGLPAADLSDKLRQFEHALTSNQDQARKESDSLQGEISRFFERTQKTNYGAVSQEMKDAHTGDELEHLGGLMGENIGIEASLGLGQWSDRFQKWGDQLEPKEENSSSGQGGQSAQSQDMTEQLIALLRLRENEMNLRDQTSVLDQQRNDKVNYKERAASLSDTQKKLSGNLEEIHQKAALPALEPAFGETAGAMEKVESVLQTPETGQPADAAEIKTIDALSDLVNLINEQAQRGKPQSSPGSNSSAEEMAFLLRMMQNTANAKAMALQPASGLNRAGGTTGQTGKPVGGNAAGQAGPTRNVDKASGVIENAPTEFRDALDNYFHGIEHSKD